MKKYTTESFIKKAKEIHGEKYDYSKVSYVNSQTKICITCPKHGDFWQTPNMHLSKNGCPKCFNERRNKEKLLTKEKFVERANIIHGQKYDYSKVDYVNIMTKVCIICPEHGEFWQTPNDHINCKHACPKCSHRSFKKTANEFIEESKRVHGNKFDYSKVEYKNENTPVCIICPEHGEFWQTPHSHLLGNGCRKCSDKINGKLKRISLEEFIRKSKEIHENRYDYSKVDYESTDKKVCIICPEHGEFWQTPHNHISQHQGCPKCSRSHMENDVHKLLTENGIDFVEQKKFDWLKYKKKLSLDFFIESLNIAIECQGEQHFARFRYTEDTDEKLNLRIKRDLIKKELCQKHGIKLIYYSNSVKKDGIINNKEDLIKELKCAEFACVGEAEQDCSPRQLECQNP